MLLRRCSRVCREKVTFDEDETDTVPCPSVTVNPARETWPSLAMPGVPPAVTMGDPASTRELPVPKIDP